MSGRQADQRTRLLRAIVEVVAAEGYQGAKIGEISSRAGVSRATFYELFESKEACFLEAHRELSCAVLARVRERARVSDADGALRVVLAEVAAVAQEQPLQFSFLTHEALLAGAPGLAARERLLAGLATLIEAPGVSGSRDGPAPDMPARTLVGAAVRTLAISIRRGESELTALGAELVAWSALYRAPAASRHWRELSGERVLIGAASEAGPATFAPRASPRGRHRLGAAEVRRTQRERILHASAAAISQKGYEHTTVADIVAAGGFSRDVFYSHLSSKRDALEQTSTLFFEQAIATMARVFFTTPESWPERVWRAGIALSEFMAGASAFTRVACIDSYAPGPAAARRIDELLLAFTVFIEQGASERAVEEALPPVTPAAVIAALAETVLALIAGGRLVELPGFVALGTYLALAPYTGVGRANEFVLRKLHELEQEA